MSPKRPQPPERSLSLSKGRPTGTDLPAPLLRARRRRTLRSGIAAITTLTVVAAVFTTLLTVQLLGTQAWQSGDPAAAGRHYAVNQQLNLMQRWIAPTTRG